MDAWITQVTPEFMGTAMMDVESFLEAYSAEACEFVDIRMDFERAVWEMKFGLQIPLNRLGECIEDLPKEKLIVLGCPTGPRSVVAWTYLSSKGYNVKFLKGGLDALTSALKGRRAKAFLS